MKEKFTVTAVMITTPARETICKRTLDLIQRSHADDPLGMPEVNVLCSNQRTATENVISALKEGLHRALQVGSDFILFLEDDIEPCKDLFGSVERWLTDHARPSIPMYSFSVPHPKIRSMQKFTSWNYPTSVFCCTQAFALDVKFAPGLIAYLEKNPTVTGPDGGVSTGAYDLAMRYWLQALRIPQILASVPSFVQHAEVASTLTPGSRGVRMPLWGGPDYVYTGPAKPSAPPPVRERPVLLWVGDAGCDSGFARCTHEILKTVSQEWKVVVLGINYRGEPHNYPYPMHPAARAFTREEPFGASRLAEMIDKYEPDVVVIQQDPWNIPRYMKEIPKINAIRPKMVGVIAVDGANCRASMLQGLDHVIFWTRFAQEEANLAGLKAPSTVIPLGTDRTTFTPGDKVEARQALGLPEALCREEIFIVGNVNRNQPRKHLDLTVRYFARFLDETKAQDAFLYLHVCPTGDVGVNVQQLAAYYGFSVPNFRRLILSQPDVWAGATDEGVRNTYRAFDVQMTTTQGEGWGLTTMEGMACGIPQILPHWSALGEWAADAALMVPCSMTSVTPVANAIGGIMDEQAAVQALKDLYSNREQRMNLRERGLALVARPEYQWARIGRRYVETLNAVRSQAQGRSGDAKQDPADQEELPGSSGGGAVSGNGDRLDRGEAAHAG
jgi:glycosyltransferase involved in cell wall biosynthesis